jgi:hypothetical protein
MGGRSSRSTFASAASEAWRRCPPEYELPLRVADVHGLDRADGLCVAPRAELGVAQMHVGGEDDVLGPQKLWPSISAGVFPWMAVSA